MFTKIKNKIDIDKILFIFAIAGCLIYYLSMTLSHVPLFDEVNAWNIAANFNLAQIFELGKYEGHTFIWYLLIMPFAKTNFFYPYSIEILNWAFAFSAILILWRYAPFNSWIKLLITFSFPMKIYFTFARCYSIGILLIFSICALYKKRLKHPILYSILLITLANTSVMGAIIAFCTGIIYCIDLYNCHKKSLLKKKDILFSVLICLFGAGIFLIQLLGFHKPCYNEILLAKQFYNFYFHDCSVILLILQCYLLFFAGLFMRKDIKPLIFLFLSNFILIYIFTTVYSGDIWHFSFLFVALIMAIWMYLSENNPEFKSEKIYISIFAIFCLSLSMMSVDFLPDGSSKEYIEYIEDNIDKFENQKIVMIPLTAGTTTIMPYVKGHNLNIYDRFGNKAHSLEAYKKLWYNDSYNLNSIEDILGIDKSAYVFVSTKSPYTTPIFKQINNKSDIKYTVTKCIYPVCIFRAERK